MHDHHHDARGDHGKALTLSLALTAGYLAVEVAGGLLTNSLALLADAGHVFSDAAALGLSLFAIWVARRPAAARRTYGYYRAEILAALANGATLVAVSVFILVEAYRRIGSPPEVQGAGMFAVAVGGLVVNLVVLRLLHAGSSESLNLRGAWLHVLADALGSVAAIAAAALVWALGWGWADPVASAVIALLVVWSSWSLLKESVSVLMEGAPAGIDVDQVRDALRAVPGCQAVHDLHVWSITTGMAALSAHLVVEDGADASAVLVGARDALRRFGISHVTIQLEPAGWPDCLAGTCAIDPRGTTHGHTHGG